MKLLPKLGLGTIYIAPLCKGLILLEHVSENLGMGMGRKVLGTQPHPTSRSASTYCVPNLNLIKRSSNS